MTAGPFWEGHDQDEQPDGREPGPGVRLIQARARMRLAVLDILRAEAAGFASGPFPGTAEADRLWAAQAEAARALVLAENAWEDAQAAARERVGWKRLGGSYGQEEQ